MNYIRLWKQAENHLILNDSIKLMQLIKKKKHIKFVRAKIKSWDELYRLYGRNDANSYIFIPEDDVYFEEYMRRFCSEEFEIAIHPNRQDLFYIVNDGRRYPITKHMVNIMKSQEFEVNRAWPITQIITNDIVHEMWEYLYNNCNKSDKNILDKIIKTVDELDTKRVRVKSWDELANEYMVLNNGIKIGREGFMFHNTMRSLCGEEFIAKYRDDSYEVGHLKIENYYWSITRGMVTEI